VDFAMGRSHSRGRFSFRRRPELVKFNAFVTNVLSRAETTTPVLISSLVYMNRAKSHLHIALEEWALERVFLGALIVASKYLNDSTLKNIHWALVTSLFGKRDIGRIEREFLDVLDWELSISEDDILAHHAGISAVLAPSSPRLFRHHHRSSHHHQIPHHYPHPTSCPDLEPSSPMSSDGSSSPQTPSTLNSSPDSFIPTKSSAAPSKSESGLRELIRAFPLPAHHSQNHFPIQL
jgi:hypothetical protein